MELMAHFSKTFSNDDLSEKGGLEYKDGGGGVEGWGGVGRGGGGVD